MEESKKFYPQYRTTQKNESYQAMGISQDLGLHFGSKGGKVYHSGGGIRLREDPISPRVFCASSPLILTINYYLFYPF